VLLDKEAFRTILQSSLTLYLTVIMIARSQTIQHLWFQLVSVIKSWRYLSRVRLGYLKV